METREEEEIVLRDQSVKDKMVEMALNVVYYGVMIGLTYLAYRIDQGEGIDSCPHHNAKK